MWRGGYFAAPDAVEIIPGLHAGAAPTRRGAKTLTRAGVSCVVDLRSERISKSPWPASVQTLSFPLAEYAPPEASALTEVSGQVAALIATGESVYVHCRAGVQRAPMVACAVLIRMGWSLADAYRLVNSRRGIAAISDAQLDVLRELEAVSREASQP